MRNNNRSNKIIGEKIIDYCDQVETLIQRFGSTFEKLNSNFAFQLSCSMCIIQIGELTKMFSDDFKAEHPEIPWRAIKAMRNVLVNEYEEVNLESAWNDLTLSIPELKTQLEKIILEEE